MATTEQNLSSEQKELVAVGASVGAGCHPCVSHHLDAGAQAGLDGERLLAAAVSAERVTAEAAVRMGDHVRTTLGPSVETPALLSRLEEALGSLGAALGANDKTSIERQLRASLELGLSREQLEQAIETARTVQENATRIHQREAKRLLDSLAESVAAPAAEANDGCGCGADTSEVEVEPAATTTGGPASRLAGAIGGLCGAGGEMGGLPAAMAHCAQMFASATSAPSTEPTAETASGGPCTKEA